MRNRTGLLRNKVDENVVNKHVRQSSIPGMSKAALGVTALKNSIHRPALSEVTAVAVNRKVCSSPFLSDEQA